MCLVMILLPLANHSLDGTSQVWKQTEEVGRHVRTGMNIVTVGQEVNEKTGNLKCRDDDFAG